MSKVEDARVSLQLQKLEETPPPPPPPSGCFIATACYGSPVHPKVARMRLAKNKLCKRSFWARKAYEAYYVFSPSVAQKIRSMPNAKKLVRGIIELLWRIASFAKKTRR